MDYIYRLSRIGDALPVDHVYPLGYGKMRRVYGAQCFRSITEAAHEAKVGTMCAGATKLLVIAVESADALPSDESGWIIVTRDDVRGVRSLPIPADPYELITGYDDDADIWGAATEIAPTWVRTVDHIGAVE